MRKITTLSRKWTVLSIFLFPSLCLAQGAHRLGQVLVRGNGVVANVAPNAAVTVCSPGTHCGTVATIYSDLSLTQTLRQPVVADASGNYSYYVPTGCYDERVSVVGSSPQLITNVCLVSGAAGLGTVTNVSIISANGFQGTVTNPTSNAAITLSPDATHYFPTLTDESIWNAKAPTANPTFTGTATFNNLTITGACTGCGGGGGGAVSSVFGRTGAVTAQTGDYSLANITAGSSPTGIFDFSSATQFVLPSNAGYTTNSAAQMGYDSTALNMHFNTGGSDLLVMGTPSTSLPTSGNCTQFTQIGTRYELTDAGAPCATGGSSGFPFHLGSTSIAASSTVASVSGLTVNGVNLNASGSSTLFLTQAGTYATPAAASGVASINGTAGAFTFSGGVTCSGTSCAFGGGGGGGSGNQGQVAAYSTTGTTVTAVTTLYAEKFSSGGTGAIAAAILAACTASPHETVVITPSVTDTSAYSPVCSGDTTAANPIPIQDLRPQGSNIEWPVSAFGAFPGQTDSGPAIRNAIQACQTYGSAHQNQFGTVVFQPGTYNIAESQTWAPGGSLSDTITGVVISGTTATWTYTGTKPGSNAPLIFRGLTSTPGLLFNEHILEVTGVTATTFNTAIAPGAVAGTYTDSGVATNQYVTGLVYQSCPWNGNGNATHHATVTYTGTDNPDTLVYMAGSEVPYNTSTGGFRSIQFGVSGTISNAFRNLLTVSEIDNNFVLQDLAWGPAPMYDFDIAHGWVNVHATGSWRWDGSGTGGYLLNMACSSGQFAQSFELPAFTMATSTGHSTQPTSLVRIDVTSNCSDLGTIHFGGARIELNNNGTGIASGSGLFEETSWGTTASKSMHLHLTDWAVQNQVFDPTTHPNSLINFTQSSGDASGTTVQIQNMDYTGIGTFNSGTGSFNAGAVIQWTPNNAIIGSSVYGGQNFLYRSTTTMQSNTSTNIALQTFTNTATQPTWQALINGQQLFGPGNSTAPDTTLARCGVGVLCINGVPIGSGGGGGITALTGDVTASGSGSVVASLATVNSNVGSFSNPTITVNAKGLITSASSGGSGGFPITLGTTAVAANSTVTSVSGFAVNGVTLDAAGSATSFLNESGTYSVPAGGGGTPAFSAVTAGTNTAALVMGTGGTFGFTGTGIVNANEMNGVKPSSLATGILKNTTSTGVPSIAIASDFPTLNQSTTGNAGTATNISTNGTSLQVWGMNSGATAQGWQTVIGSGNTTSTSLTTGTIPVANGANSIVNSLLTDNGTTLTYTGTGGVAAPSFTTNGSTNGFFTLQSLGSLPGAETTNQILMTAPNTVTHYTMELPGAQPTSGNTFVSCTAANPSVCSFTAVPVAGLSGLGTGVATALAVNTGTAGTFGTLIASGTSALGTAAIASGACATAVSTTATGVATTDAITWNPNASIKAVTGYAPSTSGGLTIAAFPTSGHVNFDVCNWTSGSITPGAVTLNWRVIR